MLTPRPIKLFLGFVAIVADLAAACAFGAGGEEIYRAKCSTCHDAGMARDIKPEAADGVVTLRGVVDNADQIKLAEAVVAKTRGVQKVDNKLIPKNMFEWD